MESNRNETKNTIASIDALPIISNARILWYSIGLTILASLMLPVQFSKKYKAEISITATGVKDQNVKGAEVWVREAFGPGIVAEAKAKGWVGDETVQASYQIQPATLKWEGTIDPNYRLFFVRHPASGRMVLTINGNTREYILYSEKDETPLEIRPYEFIGDPQPTYTRVYFRGVITILGIFLIIHLLLLFIVRSRPHSKPTISFSFHQLVLLSLPSLFIYSITLLAMWPAQMSPDSVTQWIESETGRFNDGHSAMLGFMMWVVTHIWHSPAVVPSLQLLALTYVTVLIISKFRECGVSGLICLVCAVSFPLFPANFLMVTTIWKDVPYTIALLYIFWLMISLIQTKGKSANSKTWRIGFVSALLLLIFTRHNGLLVAIGIPILCAFAFRHTAWKLFVGMLIGIIATYFLVKFIMFPFLGIPSIPKHYRPAVAIHVIGAHIVNGTSFSQQEKDLLRGVQPLERWKTLYLCQSSVPLFFGDSQGAPSYDFIADNTIPLIRLAFRKSLENPGVFIHHQACAASMLWRIFPFQGEILHTTPLSVSNIPDAHNYGLVSANKLPRIHKLIVDLSAWTQLPTHVWLFWRPGLYLLLSIVCIVGLKMATRDLRTLILAAPSILNTMSVLPFIGSPDFRYQWGVSAIGLFLIPLALFRRRIAWTAPLLADSDESRISIKIAKLEPVSASSREVSVMQPKSSTHACIAAIIPCYRVRDQILSLLSRIGPECSLIYCVDDKCPEQSGIFIKEHIKDPRIRVIFHESNQGVGGAVLTGYRAAIRDGATVMVKLDGDGQMDPSILNAFVAPIIEGSADYTKGNRFFHVEGVRDMPPLRLFGNAVLSFLTKLSSGYWSTFDPTNGYTAIHASVARSLPFGKIDRRYFFESDMLFRLNVLRARIVDIPMNAIYRGEKSSLVISSIAGEFLWKHFRNFAKRIGYNYFLRDFSIASLELILGVPLLLFGFFFGLHTWILSFETGVVSTAGTVMLSVLPSILGVQFLLSFISHDIFRTPSEPIHQMLDRLPALSLDDSNISPSLSDETAISQKPPPSNL